MVFPTKIDGWLVAVLVMAVSSAVSAVTSASSLDEGLGTALVLVAPIALVAVLSWPTQYELQADELVVRAGVIRWRLPYRELRGAEPTRSLWSAPAWSLDRLCLTRAHGFDMVISPRDKAGFLIELQKRAPHLRMEGDHLVAADPRP